jgi:hypothetical protein
MDLSPVELACTCSLGEVPEVLSRLDHFGSPFRRRFTGEP